MSPENGEAPDPHHPYRRDVEAEEDAATTAAMLGHFQRRSYAMALEVRARDAAILDLEQRLAEALAHLNPQPDTPDAADPWGDHEGEAGPAGLEPGTSGHTAD